MSRTILGAYYEDRPRDEDGLVSGSRERRKNAPGVALGSETKN